MKVRLIQVDWRNYPGAAKSKRILHLRANENGIHICPVKTCLHRGFYSSRGSRKHIDTKHLWYYYFDSEPVITREDVESKMLERKASKKRQKLMLSLTEGVGSRFIKWLKGSLGAGKKEREATTIAKRALRFLEYCFDFSNEGSVPDSYVDCCLGSVEKIQEFLDYLKQEDGHSSSSLLSYLKAISDLMDFRKTQNVPDSLLRSFLVSEIHMKRGKQNLARDKTIEYSQNLDVEQLIARNSWCEVDDMKRVIPFHFPRFLSIIKAAEDPETSLDPGDLSFCCRFIVTFLFLRVKCTRPMSYKFLTLDMFSVAKENGGYVNQTMFKTADKYLFDTLIFTPTIINVIQSYIDYIRPRCNPECEYVIVNTNGKQYNSFTMAMKLLVYDAIEKHIHPTRWRQMIESECNEQLDDAGKEVVAKDLKHSSYVSKRSYRKRRSQDVAEEGRYLVKKIIGDEGDQHTEEMANELPKDESCVETPIDIDAEDLVVLMKFSSNKHKVEESVIDVPAEKDVVPNNPISIADEEEERIVVSTEPFIPPKDIKKEEDEEVNQSSRFNQEEDNFLRLGIKKFGYGRWAKIIKHSDYKFKKGRTRDALRMRANTLKLNKTNKK